MAVYSYQAPDGRIVDLEGDSPATEQELNEIFASLPKTARAPLSPDQKSIQSFIQSEQAGPLAKAVRQAGNLYNLVAEPVRAIGGVTRGLAGVAGQASVDPVQAAQDLSQTAVEAGGRTVFDLGNQINQLINRGANQIVNNPLETALALSIPGAAGVMQLMPRTPSDTDIAQMLTDQIQGRQVGAVKSQPLVPEVIGEANLPLASDLETVATTVAPFAPAARGILRSAGAGLETLGRAATSPIQTGRAIGTSALEAVSPTIAARVAPATVEQSAIAALDFTPAQVQTHIPIVTQRVEQLVGKIPKTADEAIKFMDDAENQLYKERLEVNNAAEQQGLVARGDVALTAARDTLDAIPTITQSQRTSIMDDLTKIYEGDHLPSQGQSFQQRLNKEFSAQYENGTFDRAAPMNEAKLAIRNSFADQMDQITQAITGRAETPYADIGSLIEVKGSLSDKLNRLQTSEAVRKTGIEKAPGKLPTSRTQAATKAGRSILTPFQKTQIEKLNDNVNRIFTESSRQPPALPLQQSIINQIRASQSPVVVPNTLEARIQEVIKTLPREFRGPNERSLAEAIIRDNPR